MGEVEAYVQHSRDAGAVAFAVEPMSVPVALPLQLYLRDVSIPFGPCLIQLGVSLCLFPVACYRYG